MRILVTGGAGYIGSHAVRAFRERGHDVWVVDNLSFGHRAAVASLPAERVVVADLADEALLDHLFLEARFEGVVHFAASAYVGESVTNPAKYYRNNVDRSLRLLELVRRHRVPRFVFSSTCATYGTPATVPINEATDQKPINPYGRTKLAVEGMLFDYAAAYELGAAALRYFNAAGCHPDGTLGEDHTPETHLIPLAIDAALGRVPKLRVFGDDYPTLDGTCVRDYVHVCDLAEAHLLALERLEPGRTMRYNLGTGRGQSVSEVIRAVAEVSGRPVPTELGPRRPGDPPSLVAAADAVRADLGWAPRFVDLRETVATAHAWRRAHPHGYRSR